jgi:hypothetical protein
VARADRAGCVDVMVVTEPRGYAGMGCPGAQGRIRSLFALRSGRVGQFRRERVVFS